MGTHLIGLAAAFCTTIAFLPQVVRTWQTRSTKDLSLSMFLVFTYLLKFVHLGTTAQLLSLVTYQVSYPVIIVRARLLSIGKEYEEAAMDLGASPTRAVRRVLLPLLYPAILASLVIVSLPMFGDYYTNNLLSGSPKTTMFGNLLDNSMQSTGQGPASAVLVLFLTFALLIPMLYYLRETSKARANR